MSFEVKYDRDRNPIVPKQAPEFVAKEEVVIEQPEAPTEFQRADVVEPEQPEALQVESEKQPQQQESHPVKQTSAPQESWKMLREKAEQAERERDEALRYVKEMQGRKPEAPEEPEEDYSVNVDADALVEGKHLSKVNKQIQKLENQLKQYQQQATVNTTEAKLKAQYPDFDAIVTQENLANLRTIYPEIAHTINSSNDLYSKAVSAYTMIKKLGIVQEDNFQQDRAQAQKNAIKPKPLASVSPQQGDSPLSKANAFANGKLTDDLKAQLYKEMMESRR